MGREENEVKVYILSAFSRQVCLRLAVTLHPKSLLLSRSLLLSGWSLTVLPFGFPVTALSPILQF